MQVGALASESPRRQALTAEEARCVYRRKDMPVAHRPYAGSEPRSSPPNFGRARSLDNRVLLIRLAPLEHARAVRM